MASNVSTQRQTALITGASGGIGYEFVKLFARNHYDLVLVARRGDELSRLAEGLRARLGVAVHVIAKDLSVPDAATEVFSELEREHVAVDVLVNNAGFGSYGFFADADLAVELQMIQLNVTTLTQLTKLCLDGMLARGRGKILNVASTAAFQPGPLMAVYFATKAYVLSFSEALANELQGTGVSVTALCPGPTTSGFQRRAAMESSRLVNGPLMMDAPTVARVGYRALMRGQTVAIPGLSNQVMVQAGRFTPRRLVSRIVRLMQESTH